jgi:hypothetical protein
MGRSFSQAESLTLSTLQRNNISTHLFIVTELVLGNLPDRQNAIASLDRLPMVKVAQLHEVRRMVEAHSLFRRASVSWMPI